MLLLLLIFDMICNDKAVMIWLRMKAINRQFHDQYDHYGDRDSDLFEHNLIMIIIIPESIRENEMHNWDFEIQTDRLFPARRPYLGKINK